MNEIQYVVKVDDESTFEEVGKDFVESTVDTGSYGPFATLDDVQAFLTQLKGTGSKCRVSALMNPKMLDYLKR